MTRTLMHSTLILLGLSGAACGDGEGTTGRQGLPDDAPVAYTERSAHNPEPPSEDPAAPTDATERAALNPYGPSGSGSAAGPSPSQPPPPEPATCQLASDGCVECETAATCCLCYGSDATVCETLCAGLP